MPWKGKIMAKVEKWSTAFLLSLIFDTTGTTLNMILSVPAVAFRMMLLTNKRTKYRHGQWMSLYIDQNPTFSCWQLTMEYCHG
jgi:hypothetical protein